MAWFTEFRSDGCAEPQMICFYVTLNYRLDESTLLHVEQEAAWCEQCRRYGSAENVPSLDELRERLQQLQTPTNEHQFIYGSANAINDAIGELHIRLKWRASRTSPARCLMCGSTEITPIRFGDDGACMVNGERLVAVGHGFADTENWIAEFSPEGIAINNTTNLVERDTQ